MTDDARTPVWKPPLVCELVCGDPLDRHVEEFRVWMALAWDLTAEALLSSGTIERPDDLFDKALWEGVVGTGLVPDVKLKTRRLSAKAWADMLGGNDLRGFGMSARPLPHVPELTGAESDFSFESNWHPDDIIPNWASWLLPARYSTGVDDAWVTRLVEGFVAFGTATRAHAGLIGWMRPATAFLCYPLARTDYDNVLWLPGWAMLLSEGHIARLGGASALDASGLFHRVEQVGDGTYLVRSRTDLLDFDAAHLQEVESVLQPILLPPPYQGLDQS